MGEKLKQSTVSLEEIHKTLDMRNKVSSYQVVVQAVVVITDSVLHVHTFL